MLTVEEVELKRVRREEHFSKTRTFKKQKKKSEKSQNPKVLFFYFLCRHKSTIYSQT